MRTLTALLLLLALSSGNGCLAATYYVDSKNGADENIGVSPESAWGTLDRVNRAALGPGDSLLLKRDSVWKGVLSIITSGTLDAPLRVGAYGSGSQPLIDGTGLTGNVSLIVIREARNVSISGIELRNAPAHGIDASLCTNLSVSNLTISRSRRNGVLVFDCNGVTIQGCDIFQNAQDTSDSYDGIRIDGSGRWELVSFLIQHSTIHHNIGGLSWKSANGIFFGHTGGVTQILHSIEVTANDIYANGNPDQNQAGRGITGTFDGEILVSLNRIRDNASAGLYLGDHGSRGMISIVNNFFTNNALRQFGGYTDAEALAEGNTIFVDDPSLTAMGAEIGGEGTWTFRHNIFTYTTSTNDRFRGFIRINDATLDSRLDSDYNVFYSPGPQRWKRSDGVTLSFDDWRRAGYDAHSQNLH